MKRTRHATLALFTFLALLSSFAQGDNGVPDISAPEALKQALGLRDAPQARITVLPFGVEVIKDVSHGKYALGVSQSSDAAMQHFRVTGFLAE